MGYILSVDLNSLRGKFPVVEGTGYEWVETDSYSGEGFYEERKYKTLLLKTPEGREIGLEAGDFSAWAHCSYGGTLGAEIISALPVGACWREDGKPFSKEERHE